MLTYIGTSVLLACVLHRMNARYDRPPFSMDQVLNMTNRNRLPPQALREFMHEVMMRNLVNGEWYFACLPVLCWSSFLIAGFFVQLDIPPFAQFILAVPVGMVLSNTVYRLRRFCTPPPAMYGREPPTLFATMLSVTSSSGGPASWNETTVAPKAKTASKLPLPNTCAFLGRLVGLVVLCGVNVLVYYGGAAALGIPPIDWLAPVWTMPQLLLILGSFLVALVFGLFATAWGLTLQVQNERTNFFILCVGYFTAMTTLVWFSNYGVALTMTFGKEPAKNMLMQYGMYRATYESLGTGAALGLCMGLCFFSMAVLRRSVVIRSFCILLTLAIFLAGAHWQYHQFAMASYAWVLGALISQMFSFTLSMAMVVQDLKHRFHLRALG